MNRGRVIRSRSRVDGSGVIRSGSGMMRSGVMRSRVMGFLGIRIFADLAFVFDIGVVLLVFIHIVINNLGTAIGQLNSVLS